MTSYAGRFAGKVAVVTGAAQGIGRTVALRIAREGGRRRAGRSFRAGRGGPRTRPRLPAPKRSRSSPTSRPLPAPPPRCDDAQQRFGRIDILVNNVGGTIWAKPYAEYEEAQIEAEIRRSLFPTLWCCRAVLPGMLERGAGVIVNVSSVATRGVNRVPYAAAKGGVNAITACLAIEYAAHGIRVCGVAPGGTEARRGASRATPTSRARKRRTGTGRSWTRRSRRA